MNKWYDAYIPGDRISEALKQTHLNDLSITQVFEDTVRQALLKGLVMRLSVTNDNDDIHVEVYNYRTIPETSKHLVEVVCTDPKDVFPSIVLALRTYIENRLEAED